MMNRTWLSRTIVRDMVTFHRSATEIGSMLRCTLGVLAAFLLADSTGHAEAAPIMAVGAFICGFISLEGVYRSRMKLLLATAVGISASSFIGEMALNSLPVLILLTALVGYVNGVFAQVSRLAGAVALYTTVTFIVFSHVPLSVEASLMQALFLLYGSAIQVVLLVAFYPLSRFNIERKALAAMFRELSSFADVTSGDYRKAPPAAKFIAASQIMDDPQPFARARDIARFKRLLHDAQILRNRIAGLHALQNVLTPEQVQIHSAFVAACAAELKAIADALSGDAPSEALSSVDEQLRVALEAFEVAFSEHAVATTIAQSATVYLRDAVQGAAVIATGKFSRFMFVATARPGQYVELRLRWRSREALRLAIVLSIAMLLGHTLFAEVHGYWIALTAVLVLKPDMRTTFVRGLSRIAGTLIGAVVATAFMATHPSEFVLEALMLFFGAVCYSTFFANYGIFTISVTAFVISFLALLGLPSDASIGSRVIDTLVGGTLAMIGYLTIPAWAHKRTREVLADLIETQAAFADAILSAYDDPTTLDREKLEKIRRRAWKLRIDAEMLVDRTRSEPSQLGSLSSGQAMTILAATQSFALVNLAMESGLEGLHFTPRLVSQITFRENLKIKMSAAASMIKLIHSPVKRYEKDIVESGDDNFISVHLIAYQQYANALLQASRSIKPWH